MEFSIHSSDAAFEPVDWLVIALFEDDVPSNLPGRITEPLAHRIAALVQSKDFECKRYEILCLYDYPGASARRVLLVGMGKKATSDSLLVFRAASAAARFMARKARDTAAFLLFCARDVMPADTCAADMISGILVGVHGADLYRQERNRVPMTHVRVICEPEVTDAAALGVARGQIVGEAINAVRDLVNTTPAELYPETFCERARVAAEPHGITVEVVLPEQLREFRMGCILGVGAGSTHPPRLLVLRYDGINDPQAGTLCFVGKGITFDSGGLSLKSADNMKDMKCDMAGAATVLGATIAIARLRLPVRLLTVAALAENMPDGAAIRPGDVLTAKNGKTIEIVNTDAEGRLVLADALAHSVDLGASHIVDLATLTGSCMVALGFEVAGVMTNEPGWCKQVIAAADLAGERVWSLPMFDDYDELIKSDVADMKNSGGRWGGAITAAKLLERFVGDRPWTHVDIAGPAFAEKETAFRDSGGTGYFVRTLVSLAEHYRRGPQ